MKPVSRFCAVAIAIALLTSDSRAQEPPKPGPEHAFLKKMEGRWDLTMKFGEMQSKGTVTYKMELGGLWLTSNLDSDLAGMKFTARGLDTYDAAKKKYVSYFFDSMGTTPMIMEGTYDKDKKTMTLSGDGPGMDGKPAKWKSVSEFVDDNTHNFSMFVGDAKEPMFTIVYKRSKQDPKLVPIEPKVIIKEVSK